MSILQARIPPGNAATRRRIAPAKWRECRPRGRALRGGRAQARIRAGRRRSGQQSVHQRQQRRAVRSVGLFSGRVRSRRGYPSGERRIEPTLVRGASMRLANLILDQPEALTDATCEAPHVAHRLAIYKPRQRGEAIFRRPACRCIAKRVGGGPPRDAAAARQRYRQESPSLRPGQNHDDAHHHLIGRPMPASGTNLKAGT